ncbi:amidohydrolase family protein [Conexibacter stalactiti]|uniref:Amidohydrolase family protein n=1 Tax=Conexibacter stalactiti TaxID=1940611 RepID=A0ABU4HMK3_9ACTN|nr:amidohydrolase family protein [Conexibacter stalactiti]MDW5594504.1 amidohydrolase family protein [Conexibacter stalactiti]MEC5035146.1 amidohydrolase family protein [Conexibacter stalactiti]
MERTLIRHAHVVSLDADVGDLPDAEILIEGDTIAAIGADLGVTDCETIDARGAIAIPGFVDTHRHTWEAVVRGIAPDATIGDYFDIVLDRLAPRYRPDDVYAGNLLGALDALDGGITTLLDWSHISNTPEHSDEAIRALRDAGLRAVYCCGTPNTSVAEWWTDSARGAQDDVRRIRTEQLPSDAGLVTMSLAARGPGFCLPEVVEHDWRLARELGIPISVHVGFGPAVHRFEMVRRLYEQRLLGPDTTYIHCNLCDDEELRMIADSGGTTSVAPTVEMLMGHGLPPVARMLAHGLRPSLSVDVVTGSPGDMFSQMRTLLATERALTHDLLLRAEEGRLPADAPPPGPLLSARQVLEFATIEGARACGLDHRIGTLTPGKQADVVLITTDRPNTWPVIDPVATVVCSADTGNVETIVVAGRVVKRDGRLVRDDWARVREAAAAASARLIPHASACGHAH